MQIWWVNQGKTINQAIEGGFLWAPLISKSGRRIRNWELLNNAEIDDIVLVYSDTAVRYVGRVLAKAVLAKRPASIEGDYWDDNGRLVKVEYKKLIKPVSGKEIGEYCEAHEISLEPFSRSGRVLQGYMFPFSAIGYSVVKEIAPQNEWPDYHDD